MPRWTEQCPHCKSWIEATGEGPPPPAPCPSCYGMMAFHQMSDGEATALVTSCLVVLLVLAVCLFLMLG